MKAHLVRCIHAFVKSATWEEARALVDEYPELMGDEALRLFDRLLEGASEHEGAQQVLRRHRALLDGCRRVGIDAGFAAAGMIDLNHPALVALTKPWLPHCWEERIRVCEDASILVMRERQPQLWAMIRGELANALLIGEGGDRAQRLERAIAAYDIVLEVFSADRAPEQWARTMNNVGVALTRRIEGDRRDNLQKAAEAFESALRVRTPQSDPGGRAETLVNLADTLEHFTEISAEDLDAPRTAALVAAEALFAAIGDFDNCAIATMKRADIVVESRRARSAARMQIAIAIYDEVLASGDRLSPAVRAQAFVNRSAARTEQGFSGRGAAARQALQDAEAGIALLSAQHEPADHARALIAWANALGATGDPEDLDRALSAYEAAATVLTRDSDPASWGRLQLNRARALSRHQERNRREEAIRICEELVREQSPHSTVRWAMAQTVLGDAWKARSNSASREDLLRAVSAYDEALAACPAAHYPAVWAEAANNLLTALQSLGGAYRSRALGLGEQLLQLLRPDDDPDGWARAATNVANGYTFGGEQHSETNTERALGLFERALRYFSRDAAPSEWAQIQCNLAIALQRRSEGDRAHNVEEALACYRGALDILDGSHGPLRSQALTNYGNALQLQVRGDPDDHARQAINAYTEALALEGEHPAPERAAWIGMNLANAWTRLGGTSRTALDRAIEAYDRVLEVRTRERLPVQWATVRINRAGTLRQRSGPCDIEQAIADCTGALEALEGKEERFLEAMARLVRARARESVDRAGAIADYQEALARFTPATDPLRCRFAAAALADLHFEAGEDAQAIAVYRVALEANERLYQAARLRLHREAELGAVPGLSARAAFAAARTGAVEEAVVILERGRARGLGESLAVDDRALVTIERLDPDGYRAILQAAAEVRSAEAEERSVLDGGAEPGRRSYPGDLYERVTRAHAALAAAAERVRATPGAPEFLLPSSFQDIALTVRRRRAVAYLVVTSRGALHLCLERRSARARVVVRAVWVPDFDGDRLSRLLQQRGDDSWVGYLPGMLGDLEALSKALPPLLDELGHLVKPLMQDVAANTVALIPCGTLGLLPLHAARWDGVHALDRKQIHFAPSARALRASDQAMRRARKQRNLCAIVDPETRERPLHWAKREVGWATKHFCDSTLHCGDEATLTGLRSAITTASHVHLACHGVFDPQSPLRSCLHLADGPLTVRDILREQMFVGVRLVVLSACQTGLVGFRTVPDEAVGLPAALLSAGAAAVIGTLWPVPDLATALLMDRFYHLLAYRSPGAALRGAQRWLRRITARELIPVVQTLEATGGAPTATASGVVERLRELAPASQPYATAPLLWAAFQLVGP